MAKENKKEVSFVEGPIFQSLIRFALPVLGALILQAAYGAVDLLVVGWFGDASSISAVGTGSNFMQMVTLIITSLAMGSTVMIGQHIGEGKPDKAGKTVGTSIVLFAIIGVVMTVILELFAGPIANILQVPAESFDKTVLYLRICSGGILIIIVVQPSSAACFAESVMQICRFYSSASLRSQYCRRSVLRRCAETGRCGSSACDGSGAADFCHRLHGCVEKRQSAD